jgi:hypothetical protein
MRKFFKYLLLLAAISPLTAFAANETKTPYDQVTQGKSTAAHKYYVFDINAGASNPRLRANFSTGKIEFSNDGSTYKNFGTDGKGKSALSGTSIDWAIATTFTKTLSANTTFTFANLPTDGGTIIVRLTNTASNYTVTWPTVKWTGGTPPTMTLGAKDDVYTFTYDGATVYGSAVQDMY